MRLALAGIGKNFRGAGATLIGYARVSTHEQNHRPPSGCDCGLQAGPTDQTSGTKAERRVPGARPERWARSRRARSVCGSHDPSHHPKEGRPHDPRKRYDAIVLGSGQVSYLLLIGCFSCLGGCGGVGGLLGGTGGCGLGGGFGGWGGRAGWTSPVLVTRLGVPGFAGIGSHLDPRAALTGFVSARVIWRSLIGFTDSSSANSCRLHS